VLLFSAIMGFERRIRKHADGMFSRRGRIPGNPYASGTDVDGDGYVDAFDASLIQKYSVGLIDKFPIEE
jgi:hypothetical protein